MPKPPPRSNSGGVTPSSATICACRRSTRRAATSNPSVTKICEPMCECSPSSSRPGASSTRRTASRAAPSAIEKPNFWSSCEVEMYSWVCASTPAVTRTITLAVAPSSAVMVGQAVDLLDRVDDDATHADLDGTAQLGDGLVVAVQADVLGRELGAQCDSELTAGADVEPQTLLDHPARGGDTEERLAGVVDVGVRERVTEGASPGAEVVLVDDVGGGAELSGEVGDRLPRHRQHTIDLGHVLRPQMIDQLVGVLRRLEPGGTAVAGLTVQGSCFVGPHVTSVLVQRRPAARVRWR